MSDHQTSQKGIGKVITTLLYEINKKIQGRSKMVIILWNKKLNDKFFTLVKLEGRRDEINLRYSNQYFQFLSLTFSNYK